MSQPQTALQLATAIRLEKAQLRRSIRIGDESLISVILNPPPFLDRMMLVDLVRWGRTRRGRRRTAGVWFAQLNRQAISDGINLCVPLGDASPRVRGWLAEYMDCEAPPARRSNAA